MDCAIQPRSPWNALILRQHESRRSTAHEHVREGPGPRSGDHHRPLVDRPPLLLTHDMHAVDWLVVVAYIVWIVVDGLRRSRGTDKVEGYFLGNRSLPWWAVGLSVMATDRKSVV